MIRILYGFFPFPPENSEFQLQALPKVELYQERRSLSNKGGQTKRSLRYTLSKGKELLFHFLLELYWLNTYA